MRIDQVAEAAIGHFLGRFMRRLLIGCVLAACLIVAMYHFTIAGTLALEMRYGVLHARLAIGAIYAVVALISLGLLWQQSRIPRLNGAGKTLTSPREMQLIMLVEAVMLGYELARKEVRSR